MNGESSDRAPQSVSALHRQTAAEQGAGPAVRHKRGGVFRDITWTRYRADVDAFAAGLLELGVEVGDRVAILAENRYEWLVADLATLALGVINVPLHASLTRDQVQWHLRHCEARGVIVSDREQARKVAGADVEFVVSVDHVEPVDGVRSVVWDELLATGTDEQAVRDREAEVDADAVATIVYTSGTTADPRGAVLTHGNILFMLDAFHETIRPTSGHGVLSWLPWTHIYGRAADHYMALRFGSVLCLAESPQATLIEDLQATAPRWFFGVPQFFHRLWLKIGSLPEAHRQPALAGIVGPNMDRMTSGGAPLADHVAAGFAAAGYPIYEGYGMTEATSVITMQPFEQCRPGTVGTALVGTEVRVDDSGEVLVRGGHVMRGYWRDEAATAAVLRDGWLHTGDLGAMDADGFLRITGRKKDGLVLSTGKKLHPANVENLLMADPCIATAVAVGDGRPFLTALIVPEFAVLQRMFEGQGDLATDAAGLVTDPRVIDMFAARIEALQAERASHERVRRVLVLGRELRPENHEITATAKVRREALLGRFSAQIDALYD